MKKRFGKKRIWKKVCNSQQVKPFLRTPVPATNANLLSDPLGPLGRPVAEKFSVENFFQQKVSEKSFHQKSVHRKLFGSLSFSLSLSANTGVLTALCLRGVLANSEVL